MKNYSFIYIIFAASIWWIEWVLFLPHLYSLPVTLVVCIQTWILSLLLTPFFVSHFKNIKKIWKHDWFVIIGIALLWGVIGILAITKAFFYMNYIHLSIVVLIQKLQPLFAITFAVIFLKEKLHSHFILWSIWALIWTYIMTFWFNSPIHTGWNVWYAIILSFVAAMSFGITTVLTRKFVQHVPPLDAMYLRFVFSALILTVIILINWDYTSFSQVTNNNMLYFSFWIATGWLWIFLFNTWLKNTKASVSTLCELAFPLTVILLEFFIKDKTLTSIQLIWICILLISVSQVVKKRKKKVYNKQY